MATVLALEGDELSLSSLQAVLEPFGHTVLPLANHETALLAVRSRDFDLFLVDIQLEGLDPSALIAGILEINPMARVVAITAYPKAPQSLEVLKTGVHSLMKKPYEIGRILNLLADVRS